MKIYKLDKNIWRFFIIPLLIDRISKYYICKQSWQYWQISRWFDIYITHNTGIAFSIASDCGNPFIIATSCTFILYLAYCARYARAKIERQALLLIFSGATGNLIDRFIYGYVIDFIQIHYKSLYFPVFNIADCALTAGAILLYIAMIKNKPSRK